jgi:hypothetical protein
MTGSLYVIYAFFGVFRLMIEREEKEEFCDVITTGSYIRARKSRTGTHRYTCRKSPTIRVPYEYVRSLEKIDRNRMVRRTATEAHAIARVQVTSLV